MFVMSYLMGLKNSMTNCDKRGKGINFSLKSFDVIYRQHLVRKTEVQFTVNRRSNVTKCVLRHLPGHLYSSPNAAMTEAEASRNE